MLITETSNEAKLLLLIWTYFWVTFGQVIFVFSQQSKLILLQTRDFWCEEVV